MRPVDIVRYVAEIGLLHNSTVSLLGGGESNINYLAEDGSQKYVIRLSRQDVPGNSHFANEYHFMQFIEAIGIDFAPRPVHYDSAKDILVLSYVEGVDASIVDLNEAQSTVFVQQLKRLNSVTYDAYAAWCGKNKVQPLAPQTLAERNKINLEDRLQAIRDNTDIPFAQEVLTWADPKFAVLSAAETEANLKTVFLHDDLRWNEGGGNLKISGDTITFIDWELAGFFEAPPEIGDVLGSIPNTVADKAVVHRLYETYLGDENDVSDLKRKIRYGVLWGKLGNPLWATERYLVLSKQEHPDVDRYRYLAELGMKDAESFFTTPFDHWF